VQRALPEVIETTLSPKVDQMNWKVTSHAAHVSYPAVARMLRFYLRRCPIRRGKPQLLGLWFDLMNWRRNYTFTASSNQGIRFHLNTVDSVGSHVFLTGMWESGATALMTALLRPGDAFIDVGANIGYHTLLAAKLVGPQGRVLAVEPAPHLRSALEQNLALNPALRGSRNITIFPYCASDRRGIVVLSALAEGNSGETTLRKLSEESVTMEVEARPLDEMLSNVDLSRCNLLKMDIEGAEYLAVSGMERTLDRYPAISLMLEVDDRFLRELGSSAAILIDWFASRGYQSYVIDAPRANLDGAPVVLRHCVSAPLSPENVLFTRQPERFADWIEIPVMPTSVGASTR
jgi:FkbM family methyltransferase